MTSKSYLLLAFVFWFIGIVLMIWGLTNEGAAMVISASLFAICCEIKNRKTTVNFNRYKDKNELQK